MQETPLHEFVDLISNNGSLANIKKCIISHPEIKTLTPLIYTVHANRADVVKLLIRLRVNINAQDSHLRTALHYAVAFNRVPLIELLIKANAKLLPDKNNKTPLDFAANDPDSLALPYLKQYLNEELEKDITIIKILSQIHDLDAACFVWMIQDDALLELLPKDFFDSNQDPLKIEMPKHHSPIAKFSVYAKDLRKITNKTLLISYLNEVINAFPKQDQQNPTPISTSEKTLVHGRKTWSEMVSAMHVNNLNDISRLNIKENLIGKLVSMGFQDAKSLYDHCVRTLQETSVIVINFNAYFLHNKESADYQALNIFERGRNNFATNKSSYSHARNLTEQNLFKSLDDRLKSAMQSIHARPKYGRLCLIDRNTMLTGENFGYGRSFVVLKDIVKFNSLFNYRDSMNGGLGNMTPCSYLNLAYLLSKSTSSRIRAIAELAIHGTAKSPYDTLYIEEYI